MNTEMAAAGSLAREMLVRERGPRDALLAWQAAKVDEVVRRAIQGSRLHRERLSDLGGDGRVRLDTLPILDKTTATERFDDLVVDDRLRRDELRASLWAWPEIRSPGRRERADVGPLAPCRPSRRARKRRRGPADHPALYGAPRTAMIARRDVGRSRTCRSKPPASTAS